MGALNKDIFRLPRAAYLSGSIDVYGTATRDEVRVEYQRLRRIALKRLSRFEGSEFTANNVYRLNSKPDAFPALSTIETDAALSRELSHLHSFLASPQSSVQGLRRQRKAAITRMHDNGYTFINAKNYGDFGRYMEAMRGVLGKVMLASDRIASQYEMVESGKISAEDLEKDFKRWLNRERIDSSAPQRIGGESFERYQAGIARRASNRASYRRRKSASHK